MRKKEFINKYLGNANFPFTSKNRDEMLCDLNDISSIPESVFKNIEVKTFTDNHYYSVISMFESNGFERYFIKDHENGVREIIFREVKIKKQSIN